MTETLRNRFSIMFYNKDKIRKKKPSDSLLKGGCPTILPKNYISGLIQRFCGYFFAKQNSNFSPWICYNRFPGNFKIYNEQFRSGF